MSNFYDFTVKDDKGNDFALNQFKGKAVLVVNVASKCGFTPQYEGLETLYSELKDKGLMVLGFPATNLVDKNLDRMKIFKAFAV